MTDLPSAPSPPIHPLTPRQRGFLDQAVRIRSISAQDDDAVAFYARVLVQASLPHRDPGNVPVWGRANGNFSLSLQPGVRWVHGKPEPIGLPFGTIPRLLMAWITTEAVRTRDRTLFLGTRLSEFMREIGMEDVTGGANGTATRLREQMQRLFAARISFQYDAAGQHRADNLQLARKQFLFWDERRPEQAVLFNSYIVLDHDFYEEVIRRPVPIDIRALRLLKQSPMALDLYSWLTYRMSRLERPAEIPWTALERQLGSEYESTRDFAKKVRKILRRIQSLYPGLQLEERDGRLVLIPSTPHVRRQLAGE